MQVSCLPLPRSGFSRKLVGRTTRAEKRVNCECLFGTAPGGGCMRWYIWKRLGSARSTSSMGGGIAIADVGPPGSVAAGLSRLLPAPDAVWMQGDRAEISGKRGRKIAKISRLVFWNLTISRTSGP